MPRYSDHSPASILKPTPKSRAEFLKTAERHLCGNAATTLRVLGILLIANEALRYFSDANPPISIAMSVGVGAVITFFPKWCVGMPEYNWARFRLVCFAILITAAWSIRLGGGEPSAVQTPACLAILCLGVIARDRKDALPMIAIAAIIAITGAQPWQVSQLAVTNSLMHLVLASGGAFAIAALFEQLRYVDTESHQKLWSESRLDPLTGLGNRRYFDEIAQHEGQIAQSMRITYAVLMIDIDHFKKINDTHGHDGGDLVLREVAARLRTQARGGDIIARYGGEEFAAFFPNTREKMALSGAERFRRAICSRPIVLSTGITVNVSISIGIASAAEGENFNVKAALDRADAALYRAKANGRNRCICWTDEFSNSLPDPDNQRPGG
jgi:diguanylate cyclase (GGDEF)-like protein